MRGHLCSGQSACILEAGEGAPGAKAEKRPDGWMFGLEKDLDRAKMYEILEQYDACPQQRRQKHALLCVCMEPRRIVKPGVRDTKSAPPRRQRFVKRTWKQTCSKGSALALPSPLLLGFNLICSNTGHFFQSTKDILGKRESYLGKRAANPGYMPAWKVLAFSY